MHLRYRLVTLLTLCLCCVAAAAFAAKPTLTTEPIGTVTNIERIDLNTPNSTAAACKVGENGVPAILVDYFFPPQDEYLTLLDPASCAACPAPALLLTTAHAFLNFRVACSMSVTVRIVGATQDASGCYMPDVNSVICPPVNYLLAPGAVGNFDFSMALPSGCCIDRPAFLSITVNSFGTCPNTTAGRPRLITTGSCVPCRSWNFYPVGNEDELCSVGFPGNPIMNVDADCCQVTPTLPGSWGKVKTLYR
jgi:hypothetical protein